MSKKIWYSKPLKFYWKELYGNQKNITPNYSDLQIFEGLRYNLINSPLRPGELQETRELIISGLELWKEDLNKNFLHIFFVDKELRDFLETTKLADLDGVREYLYNNGDNRVVEYIQTKESMECVVYSFGLHLPFETDGYAFSLILFKNDNVELFFSHGNNNGRISNEFYNEWNKKQDEHSIAICNMFRLAINTLAYMKCFPECVTDGVPNIPNEKHKEQEANSMTFMVSDKIQESDNSPTSKMPHFRKGYFKMLRSDYFTNKKGQLIYIAETMVNGKAKTVAIAENINDWEGQYIQ